MQMWRRFEECDELRSSPWVFKPHSIRVKWTKSRFRPTAESSYSETDDGKLETAGSVAEDPSRSWCECWCWERCRHWVPLEVLAVVVAAVMDPKGIELWFAFWLAFDSVMFSGCSRRIWAFWRWNERKRGISPEAGLWVNFHLRLQ